MVSSLSNYDYQVQIMTIVVIFNAIKFWQVTGAKWASWYFFVPLTYT